jgi:hypothetical protein
VRHGSAYVITLGDAERIFSPPCIITFSRRARPPKRPRSLSLNVAENGRLRLRPELHDFVARPDLKLQPSEKPADAIRAGAPRFGMAESSDLRVLR